MRLSATFAMIGVGLLTSGCQLTWDMTQNLVFRACMFTDAVTSKAQYHHQANEAWQQYCGAHPDHSASPSFGKGFRSGYAEYLEEGGDTCPPPLPPMKYWKNRYQNAAGRVQTKLWADGYSAGATAAKESGARNFIVVPVNKCPPSGSAPPGAAPGAPGATVVPPIVGPGLSPTLPPPASEKELPPPQPVPDPAPARDNKSPAVPPKEPQVQHGTIGSISAIEEQPAGRDAGSAPLVPVSSILSQEPDADAAPLQPISSLLTDKSGPKNP